jgi:UDP-N-acetylmuramate dehydrogenase
MRADKRDLLVRRLGCPLRTDVPLSPLTTLRVGGPARILAEPRDTTELSTAFEVLRAEQVPWLYLGLGSNIIVSDAGFDGVVIRAQQSLCRIKHSDSTLTAGPGARLLDLTIAAAALQLSGMEQLSGIPGTVGGGLAMNAGAYGAEISDTLREADVLLEDGGIVTFTKDKIGFGYRKAPALQNVIILESRYQLKTADKAAIYSEMRRVWKLRREKQPLNYPSAGSIFKRPAGDYAGRLIEQINGKGMRVGGAMVSEKHAGIFVNVGGATAADMIGLIRDVRRRVFENSGILLEPEVRTVGFTGDPFDLAS